MIGPLIILIAGVGVGSLLGALLFALRRRGASSRPPVTVPPRPPSVRPARRRAAPPPDRPATPVEIAPGSSPNSKSSPTAGPERRPLSWDAVDLEVRERVEQRISALSSLPTMMTQLLSLLQDLDSDPQEIARTASTDPAVVAEILRTVNASYSGLRSRMSDVSRAILMLGYSRVKLLVLKLGVDGSLPSDPEYKARLTAIWRHSFITSEAVAYLDRRYGSSRDHEATTAALLHDLGKLVLLELRPRSDLDKQTVFQTKSRATDERIFVEEDYFGVNHCLVGGLVADKLGLSATVKTVQSLHHHPLGDPRITSLGARTVRCIAAVKLGNLLSNAFAEHSLGAGAAPSTVPELDSYRRYYPALPSWQRLTEECRQTLRDAASFLESCLPATGRTPVREPQGEATPADATTETDAPQSIAGRYTLLEKLGTGSVGTVYLCEDALLGHRFAIKLMHPAADGKATALDVFLNEVRVALNLAHPNIVRVFHLDQRDGVCFILQEFLEGRSLAAWIREAGEGIGEEAAIGVATQMAEALAHAHRRGVIHRDVNPNNVMVDPAGRIKLLDFGVAACKDLGGREGADSWGYVAGTPSYMSPEHWLGYDRVAPGSDIYSLGVALYEMLCGRRPFAGRTQSELREAQRSGHVAALPGVSTQLNQLVLRCLEADPSKRWTDCDSLARQLTDLAARPVAAT